MEASKKDKKQERQKAGVKKRESKKDRDNKNKKVEGRGKIAGVIAQK